MNGTIAGAATSYVGEDEAHHFSMLIDPSTLIDGDNRIDVLVAPVADPTAARTTVPGVAPSIEVWSVARLSR